MTLASYSGRRVLVTGGASFIGSHLVEALLTVGADVTVVDDFSSGERRNLAAVEGAFRLIEGDLRDSAVAAAAVRGREIVFHLANIHGGRGFIETHPAEIAQNLVIDGNMLRAAQGAGVERFCYASSACVYPVGLQGADPGRRARYLSEDMADPFKPGAAQADGVYGWGKLMGEMALAAYHAQFGLNGVSCRLFTVYGPRENESHAIIAFIAKAVIGQDPFEIWGDGTQDRNFTHVSDVVEGLMRAALRIEDARAVNIGADEITVVRDAAKVVCDLVGHAPSAFHFDLDKPAGVSARAASVENQIAWLDWRPRVGFAEGIAQTVDWYLSNCDVDRLKTTLERRLFER